MDRGMRTNRLCKSVKEVRAVVGAIVASKNSLDCAVVSHGWWDRFRSCHPHLTLRMGETLAYRWAVGLNRVVIDNYFDLLGEVLESNDLSRRPHLVFNADETGLPSNIEPESGSPYVAKSTSINMSSTPETKHKLLSWLVPTQLAMLFHQ